MVCELICWRCNSRRSMTGYLPSAWNTKITLHQLFGNYFEKWNVIICIQNCFRNNYVIIFCQMVLSSASPRKSEQYGRKIGKCNFHMFRRFFSKFSMGEAEAQIWFFSGRRPENPCLALGQLAFAALPADVCMYPFSLVKVWGCDPACLLESGLRASGPN